MGRLVANSARRGQLTSSRRSRWAAHASRGSSWLTRLLYFAAVQPVRGEGPMVWLEPLTTAFPAVTYRRCSLMLRSLTGLENWLSACLRGRRIWASLGV